MNYTPTLLTIYPLILINFSKKLYFLGGEINKNNGVGKSSTIFRHL